VVNQNTIFIFQPVIKKLSNEPHIHDRLEQSTIMHEFAHLLMLEHIDQPDCIMTQTVEVLEHTRYQAGNIPTEFCPETLFQLDRLKRSFR
jgi:predicted Zn-dependent protease